MKTFTINKNFMDVAGVITRLIRDYQLPCEPDPETGLVRYGKVNDIFILAHNSLEIMYLYVWSGESMLIVDFTDKNGIHVTLVGKKTIRIRDIIEILGLQNNI